MSSALPGCTRGAVEVLDAQQPAAAVLAGIEVAAERGNQRTEMQRPGGRGGEAADVAHCATRAAPADQR